MTNDKFRPSAVVCLSALAALAGAAPADAPKPAAAAVVPAPPPAGQADYASARWVAAFEGNYTKTDKPRAIEFIVIHTIEGGKEPCLSWFKNPKAQVSAHFVVGFDGEVVQMVREQDIAWHAGNWDYNTKAVGIEHEGFTAKNEWTIAQYKASAALTAYLCKKYRVPVDRDHIIGHIEVKNQAHGHTDPGKYFDWDLYIKLVKEGAGAAQTYLAQKTKDSKEPPLADRIREWWKLIEDYDRKRNFYDAVRILRRIAYNTDDPPNVEKAKARLAAYLADPVVAKAIADEDEKRSCESLMSFGRTYAVNGLLAGAIIQYQKLVDLYPSSPLVPEARKQIDQLTQRLGGKPE